MAKLEDMYIYSNKLNDTLEDIANRKLSYEELLKSSKILLESFYKAQSQDNGLNVYYKDSKKAKSKIVNKLKEDDKKEQERAAEEGRKSNPSKVKQFYSDLKKVETQIEDSRATLIDFAYDLNKRQLDALKDSDKAISDFTKELEKDKAKDEELEEKISKYTLEIDMLESKIDDIKSLIESYSGRTLDEVLNGNDGYIPTDEVVDLLIEYKNSLSGIDEYKNDIKELETKRSDLNIENNTKKLKELVEINDDLKSEFNEFNEKMRKDFPEVDFDTYKPKKKDNKRDTRDNKKDESTKDEQNNPKNRGTSKDEENKDENKQDHRREEQPRQNGSNNQQVQNASQAAPKSQAAPQQAQSTTQSAQSGQQQAQNNAQAAAQPQQANVAKPTNQNPSQDTSMVVSNVATYNDIVDRYINMEPEERINAITTGGYSQLMEALNSGELKLSGKDKKMLKKIIEEDKKAILSECYFTKDNVEDAFEGIGVTNLVGLYDNLYGDSREPNIITNPNKVDKDTMEQLKGIMDAYYSSIESGAINDPQAINTFNKYVGNVVKIAQIEASSKQVTSKINLFGLKKPKSKMLELNKVITKGEKAIDAKNKSNIKDELASQVNSDSVIASAYINNRASFLEKDEKVKNNNEQTR